MEYVNLLPESFMRKRLRSQRALLWTAVAAGVLFLVVGFSLLIDKNLAATKMALKPMEQQVAQKRELTDRIVQLEKELQRNLERQTMVRELREQSGWTHALADIANAAQDSTWLERLRLTEVKVKPGRERGRGSKKDGRAEQDKEATEVRFSARGYSLSNFELANFMARLDSSSHFGRVELKYSELTQSRNGKPVIEFEIEGVLL